MKSFKQLREECGCKDKERKTKSKKTVEVMPQVKDGSGMKIGVKEEAPSGKKYERMIKHIKRSYAKDGKLTKDEKSIAYATACLLYTSPSPRDRQKSRMPSSA